MFYENKIKLSKIKFKENTSYTFIISGYNSGSGSKSVNLRINFTDGTYNYIPDFPTTAATKQVTVYRTNSAKTVLSLTKSNRDNSNYIYYDESGIFEGVLTAEDFSPFGQYHDFSFPVFGKNLFNGTQIDGYISDDGSEGIDGYGGHSDFISVTPGDTYTYSCVSNYDSANTTQRKVIGYNADKQFVQLVGKLTQGGTGTKTFTVTIPTGVEYVRITFYYRTSYPARNDSNIQFEAGSSATTYEAFKNTVYGGSLNVNTGVLTVDRMYENLSSKTWTTRVTGEVKKLLSSSVTNYYKTGTTSSYKPDFITDSYNVPGSTAAAAVTVNDIDERSLGVYGLRTTASHSTTIYTILNVGDTPTGNLVYKLETPIEYQLTASQMYTLVGTNNVWADSGDVKVYLTPGDEPVT